MKKIILTAGLLFLTLNLQAQSLGEILGGIKKITEKSSENNSNSTSNSNIDLSKLSSGDVSNALKQALSIGVEEGVQKLSAEDGFYKNELVKILMPEELRNVESLLRTIGLGSLADEGVKLFNRAAEDAVSEAAPIFANAITSISFDDAKDILLSSDNAATNYLKTETSVQLFDAFEPKVASSLDKVGANDVWNKLITTYNSVAGKNINTNLNEYVTDQAIDGVFKMVAEKESGIRNNAAFRTTSILKDVFGALDKN